MPLAAPPSRGFSEFQRGVPWDTGSLFGHASAVVNNPEDSGTIDVSRYSYLGGFEQVSANLGASFTWYLNAAATIPVAFRFLALTSLINNGPQYRLPNLGPFLQVEWALLGGGATFTHTIQLFGTDRVHPCELIPQNPVPIDQDATAIGSSATATVYPSDYYSGPMMIWSTISGGGTVFFQYLTAANAWNTISQWPVAALTNDTRTVIAPPGAWRFQVLNGVASNQVYNLKVTPSLTGGS